MNTPAERIAAAVAGKPDAATRVEYDDQGKPYTVETHGLAAVLAGDVCELVKGLGDKADAVARDLAKGAAGVAPEVIVYQRADQLRAVVALVVVPAATRPVPEVFEAPAAPEPIAPETRRRFNPSGK